MNSTKQVTPMRGNITFTEVRRISREDKKRIWELETFCEWDDQENEFYIAGWIVLVKPEAMPIPEFDGWKSLYKFKKEHTEHFSFREKVKTE